MDKNTCHLIIRLPAGNTKLYLATGIDLNVHKKKNVISDSTDFSILFYLHWNQKDIVERGKNDKYVGLAFDHYYCMLTTEFASWEYHQ